MFRGVFLNASRAAGSLCGCRLSGTSLRQLCRCNSLYSVDSPISRPSAASSLGLILPTTKMPPWVAVSKNGLSSSASCSCVKFSLRLPPRAGRLPLATICPRMNWLRNRHTRSGDIPMDWPVCSRFKPYLERQSNCLCWPCHASHLPLKSNLTGRYYCTVDREMAELIQNTLIETEKFVLLLLTILKFLNNSIRELTTALLVLLSNPSDLRNWRLVPYPLFLLQSIALVDVRNRSRSPLRWGAWQSCR